MKEMYEVVELLNHIKKQIKNGNGNYINIMEIDEGISFLTKYKNKHDKRNVIEVFEYNGYKGSLNYLPHDQIYQGKILDIKENIYYSGKDRKEAELNFQRVVNLL